MSRTGATLTVLSVLITLSGCAVTIRPYSTLNPISAWMPKQSRQRRTLIARREGVQSPFRRGPDASSNSGIPKPHQPVFAFLFRCAIHVRRRRCGRSPFSRTWGAGCQPGFRPLS